MKRWTMGKANGRSGIAGAALLGMLALALPARAQPIDVRLIPPNVMLVVDSSGSMEYLNIEHRVPFCANDPTRDDPAQRTRWMQVQDALLGPISDATYSCERFVAGQCVKQGAAEDCTSSTLRDQRFWIPGDWVIPQFVSYGERDVMYGILERYRERARFGFSTFDSFFGSQDDDDGMWSYQSADEPISWRDPATGAVIQVNVGIRRADAAGRPVFGGFVPWGSDAQDLNELNAKVRAEVNESICYCGSPVAAAFRDVRNFFLTDPSNLAPAAGGNDCFWDCRERYVVLITDGLPNTGEGNPYPSSAAAAGQLWGLPFGPDLNPHVYVIGYSLCPAGTTEGTQVRAVLDQIACQGCPSGETKCLEPACHALDASNTDELIAALDKVLYVATSEVSSRTLVQTTNQVNATDPSAVVQYQFNTGLRISGDQPWEGILERSGYVCNASGKVVVSTDLAHYTNYGDILDARLPPRALKTVSTPVGGTRPTPFTAPVALENFVSSNPNLTPTQLGAQGTELTDPTFVDDVVSYMHGAPTTVRAGKRLGDIYHASVAVVGRPNLDIPVVSYYKFQQDEFDRLQVAYAATNDGIVHAFRANNTVDPTQTGEELWGYIPNYLLPRVQAQMDTGHLNNLDSTPIVRDIRAFKGATTDPTVEDWRTVLIGGYRQGGRGYYALDVTDPEAPELLWEINNTTQDLETAGANDYQNLYLTYATPMIGTAFIPNLDETGRPLGELSVTIFPGGYNSDQPRTTTTDLYVVTTKTGRLVRKLTPIFPTQYGCTGSCDTKPECCAQLITSPVGYGSLPGLVTTRVFVGDDRGRIWRADLASSDPSQWTLDLFYPHPAPPLGDPDPLFRTTGPVKFPPAVSLNKDNQLVLIYGTGDVDNVAQLDQNYMVSVTERIEFDTTVSRYTGRAHLNWAHPFPDRGEKLAGVPIVFDNVAYFATFAPMTDETNCCEFGEGRIWGVVYNDDDPNDDGDITDWAALDQDADLTTADDKDLYQPFENTYVAGLNVIQRPSCISGSVPPAPGISNQSREVFEIVAQVGGTGGSTPGHQTVPTITLQIPTPPVVNYADSWGSVFE